MSNVVKFKRPAKPKEPRKLTPALRRTLTAAAVIAALAVIWTWFYLTGSR